METTQKKGMSKGCMIGLIIGIVIIVIILVGGWLCYANRGKLAKMGMTTVIAGVQSQVTETPPDGLDVDQFKAMSAAFLEKINASELSDEELQDLSMVMQTWGTMARDEVIDLDEATTMMDDMVDMYPDLESYLPAPDMEEMDDMVEGEEEAAGEEVTE